MVALVPAGWAASVRSTVVFLQNRIGQRFFPQSRPETCGGRLSTVLCVNESFFFFWVLQRRAVFQSTPVRGSREECKRLSRAQ